MQVEAGEEASWLAQRLKACRTHWKTMFTANTSKKNQSVDGQHAGGGLLEACVCSFHLCAERAGGSKKNFGVLFSVSRCAGLYRETILDSNEKERAEKSCAMMPACRCSPASSPSAPLSFPGGPFDLEAGGIGLQKPRLWPWPPQELPLFAQKGPSLSFCAANDMQAKTAGVAVPHDPQSTPLMACFLQRNQMQKQLIATIVSFSLCSCPLRAFRTRH